MISTTIEQSQRLLDAGLSVDTADLSWRPNFTYENGEYKPFAGFFIDKRVYLDFSENAIPAWSMSAVWNEVSKVGKFAFEEQDTPEDIIERLVKLYEEYKNRGK